MTASRPTTAQPESESQAPTENSESLVLEVAQTIARKKLGRHATTSLKTLTVSELNGTFQCNDHVLKVTKGMRALRAFKKERWCMNQAGRLGIHVPKVIEIGRERQFAFWIAATVRGTSGADVSIDYQRMWTRMGEYSRKLGSIGLQAFGKNFRGEENSLRTWQQWTEFELNYLFKENAFWLQSFKQAELDAAMNRLNALSKIVAEPVLANGEFSETNTVVDPHGNVYLMEWGSAGGYPGFWDLAHVCAWHEPNHTSIQCFCRGYGLNDNNFLDLRHAIEAIQLWRWFSSIRWAANTQPDSWAELDFVQLSISRIKQLCG